MWRTRIRMLLFSAVILCVVILSIAFISIKAIEFSIDKKAVSALKEDARFLELAAINNYDPHVPDMVFLHEIRRVAQVHHATVRICQPNGQYYIYATEDATHFNMRDEDYGALSDAEKEVYLQPVLQKEYLLFHNREDNELYNGITLCLPVITHNEVKYALIINMPVDTINAQFERIRISIWAASGFMFLIGCVAMLLFAIHFTHPYRRILDYAHASEDKKQNLLHIRADKDTMQIAEAFNELIEKTKNQESLRAEFLANVSHELRSPMTSIRGFIEGMLDGTVKQEDRDYYLGIVLNETKRLSTLVNDLLVLSQIQSGHFQLHKKLFDMNEMLRLAVIKQYARIEDKNIEINMILSNEEACMVYADADRIAQVVDNILDNAIKFSPSCGTITLIAAQNEEEHRVLVSIQDEGVGIAESEMPLLFERFHTLDKAHSPGSGTGLGLAIVKNILNQHNETITVSSVLGKGSIFTFTLATSAPAEVK